ncbi:MAG: hypothetical protein IKC90_01950 [Akkermansia sp.]|nr:hypothetical protein [Akkermansia sp.]
MNPDNTDQYADIIHLPRPVSHTHPPMSLEDRAAQFSPFAALTGHDAAIAEAARLTEQRPILDEYTKWQISDTLQQAAADPQLSLHIVYFVPDTRKTGGSYAEACGCVKKLIPHRQLLILNNGQQICINDIVELSCHG